MKLLRYIANQLFPEGIDELQTLLLCQGHGLHAALAGPPGVGKTECVREIAQILGLELYTKTCSTRTSESHIISFPVLEREGQATVTRHKNGPLARAMSSGGVFYADEFNLLKEDTQKRLNSAIDDRRSIDRNDGVQIVAKPGFWAVVSYNPTDAMNTFDIEESVADRFVHVHFRQWSSDFLGYVSQLKSARRLKTKVPDPAAFGISLSFRAIGTDGRLLSAEKLPGRVFTYRDFFTDEEVGESKVAWLYRTYDIDSIHQKANGQFTEIAKKLKAIAYEPSVLSRALSQFVTTTQEMARTGTSKLLKDLGLGDLHKQEDAQLLSIHFSGVRIISAALTLYSELVRRGCNTFLAQSFATRIVVDQMCYGQFRTRKMTAMTSHEMVSTIAKGMGLFAGASSYNIQFLKEKLSGA